MKELGMFKKFSFTTIAGIALALVLMVALPVGVVQAADFSHDNFVGEDEVIDDDVFLDGQYCQMEGTINGNLVATCESIEVTGAVNGDAFLFAETINVAESAVIDGNVFGFGAQVTVDGQVTGSFVSAGATVLLDSTAVVARNAYMAGFETKLADGAQVGMDLFSGANQIIINGDVARDVAVGTNTLELRGSIGRNAKVELGTDDTDVTTYSYYYSPGMQYIPADLKNGLRVYEGANIAGDLSYSALDNVDEQVSEYVAGTIDFNQLVEATRSYSTDEICTGSQWINENFGQLRITRSFSRMITYFAIGALAFWLVKKQSTAVRDRGYAMPGKAFGWGFVSILVGFMGLILVPGTFVLLGILLGVVSLGGLLFTWYGVVGTLLVVAFVLFFFLVFTLSKIIAAYVFGYWLMKDVFKAKNSSRWIDLLVGVLFYVILRAIPFFGMVVGFAATLFGTGALFIRMTKVEKKAKTEAVEAE